MMTSLSLYLWLLSKQLSVGNLTFITPCSKHIQPVTYICQLNCHVQVWHGKTRDFIIDGTIYWVRLFAVSEFERKEFFLLRNIGKIDQTFKSVRAIHGIRPIQVQGTEVWLYIWMKIKINFNSFYMIGTEWISIVL